MSLSLDTAKRVLEAMKAEAHRRGVPSAYAVVDAGGHLLLFEAKVEAILLARELAINKAWTALSLGEATSQLGDDTAPGGDFHGLLTGTSGRPLVPFAGGQPLGSPVVGACGVSGGSLDDDEAISLAGLRAFDDEA